MHVFARVGGSLAAGFLALEVLESFLRNFLDFQRLDRFVCDTPVIFLGLAARCSPQLLKICFLLHLDFDTDNLPAQNNRRRSSQLHTLYGWLSENKERSDSV